jgi:hypothetical protein
MKVWNYMALMLTMMVFLFFLGFNPAGSKEVVSTTGIQINQTNGELIEGDISNSEWYNNLFNLTDGILVALGIAGAVFVGFFTKSFDWRIALSGFFLDFVIKFLSLGWSIVSMARDTGETWLIGIVATIFLPITAMFIMSIVEWFAGVE